MKIKYGNLGIVALIVYYTIKINSKAFELLNALNEPLSLSESLLVAFFFCIPFIILSALND